MPLNDCTRNLARSGIFWKHSAMCLDDSSSRITEGGQQMPKECRRLLEACKLVCYNFHADFSEVVKDSTPMDRMKYNHKLRCKACAASDAAAKLRIWKMNLGLVTQVMNKHDEADMAKAHEVEIAIETFRQAIYLEMDQVDSEFKSTGESLGSLDEMDSYEWNVAYEILLPLTIRQAALSQSTGMCEIAAEALKNMQTPEIADTAAQSRPAKLLSFYSGPRTRMILVSQDHTILYLGHGSMAEFNLLAKQAQPSYKEPVA
ncbi:hypothetical protein HDV64DRAFT_288134 [Trichoderma sp. TUCIM 5745]